MLKLTYTDNDFSIERLSESLEDWLNIRVLICLRSATSIYVEPSTASFLIPTNLPYWEDLKALKIENDRTIELNICDTEYLEIILQGTWVTSEENSDEGVFVCVLSKKAEILVNQLWQESQTSASAI